jgi:hypothetical protein
MFHKFTIALALTFSFGFASTGFGKPERSLRKPASGSRIGSSNATEIPAIMDETKGKDDIARIQKYVEVKSIKGGRIGLALIDSGGSTDISSMMVGANLYLTFFKDGEMHNLKAAFDLGGMNDFSVVSVKNSTVTLKLKCKDESLKGDIVVESLVNFTSFEKDFVSDTHKGTDDWSDILVSGKVTMTKPCLPEIK